MNTDTQDTVGQVLQIPQIPTLSAWYRGVSRPLPRVIGQNVHPVVGQSEVPWHWGHRGVFILPIWHIRAASMPCTATGPR